MEVTNFKLISKIYLRPVNCFDLNFVFGTSWWKSPTPGISSLSIWLFFFHPNRHSVPEKAKKVVKILHRWRRRPWEFFFPGLFFLQLGLLIFTFVQVLCGQEHKNPDANDDDVTKHNTNNNLYKNGCDFTQSPDSDIYLQIDVDCRRRRPKSINSYFIKVKGVSFS